MNDGNCPLYPGADLTVNESTLIILKLASRHKMSKAALLDLMRVTKRICPENNKCINSIYKLKKIFDNDIVKEIRHYYCKTCHKKLENKNDTCSEHKSDETGYFIEIPLEDQLQVLFRRPRFYEKLNYRFERKQDENSYSELYDGSVYKKFATPDLLGNRNNISFTLYTDSFQTSNSSSEMWVICLAINELEYKERVKLENLLIVGLSCEKPELSLFLKPLYNSMMKLAKGVNFEIPDQTILVKGIIICFIADQVAKAFMMNMTKYNGKFGCQTCTQKSTHLKEDHVRIYDFQKFDLRTDAEHLLHIAKCKKIQGTYLGVKGPSMYSKIVMDPINAASIDSMHALFRGVVRQLLNYLIGQQYSREPYSIRQHLKTIEERISSLKPPSFVQRFPSSIDKHAQEWKAHDYKNWFFHYSAVTLCDLLPENQFEHYKLLLFGVSILFKSSISEEDLNLAERALQKFVSQFADIYKTRYMSSNVHLLLHLVDQVRKFGPLPNISAFPFEDMNGQLKNLVHGSTSPELQISSSISFLLSMVTFKQKFMEENSEAANFYDTLDYRYGRLHRHIISKSLYIIGTTKSNDYFNDKMKQLLRKINDKENSDTRYITFQRLLNKKYLYNSVEYKRPKRTTNCYISYEYNNETEIGQILKFVRSTQCKCRKLCHCEADHYAIIEKYSKKLYFDTKVKKSSVQHIFEIKKKSNKLQIVDVKYLRQICYFYQTDDNRLLCSLPLNDVEFE